MRNAETGGVKELFPASLGAGRSPLVSVADKRKQKYSQRLIEATAAKSADYSRQVTQVISSLDESGLSAPDIKDIINMGGSGGSTPLVNLLQELLGRAFPFPVGEELVKKLLSMGADPYLKTERGVSALDYLCSYWNPDCFKGILRELLFAGNESYKSFTLSPAGVAKPPLVLMSLNGRLTPEIIHIFADAGANMCATDSDGNTALSPEVFLRGWTDLIFKGAPINKGPFAFGCDMRRDGFAKQVKVAKELLALGVPLHIKGRAPRISEIFMSNPEEEEANPGDRGENLLVLIAAGGYEQLREYYRDGLRAGPFFGVDTGGKPRTSKSVLGGHPPVYLSMLTLLSLGLIYPETDEFLQELWSCIPQGWGMSRLLDNLKDAGEKDIEAFVPLFVNIIDIQRKEPGDLKIKDENSKVLIQLLSAVAEDSPEAVVRFISQKLKGQIKKWGGQEDTEELTTKLGAFMRDKETQKEVFGELSF